MTSTVEYKHNPNWATAPGDTLLETLEYLGMSRKELAASMGYPVQTIQAIIEGKGAITPEIACQLEQVLPMSASYWLKGEEIYRTYLARLAADPQLSDWMGWLKKFPLQEMIDRGWVASGENPSQQVFEFLRFFGISKPATWGVRRDEQLAHHPRSARLKKHAGALTVWLRQGELKALEVEVKLYREESFRQVLQRIRALTAEPVSCVQEKLMHWCAEVGVVVLFVPELSELKIRAATQWLALEKVLIQLSPNWETDEQFWFTFFHAAGHILLHKKYDTFLETGEESRNTIEEQADAFAANLLIDTHQRKVS
jgi:HTH-type transcriptional regulator / antitoxin HigA